MRHEVQGQTADISDGWPNWTMLGKELRALELQGKEVGQCWMKRPVEHYRHAKAC